MMNCCYESISIHKRSLSIFPLVIDLPGLQNLSYWNALLLLLKSDLIYPRRIDLFTFTRFEESSRLIWFIDWPISLYIMIISIILLTLSWSPLILCDIIGLNLT